MSEAGHGGLSGQVAVVTGAGSGLGRAAALALARQGARVVAADFDSPRMERTVEEILRLGSADSALALATDVRDDASVRGLGRSALKTFGRVDILINNAANNPKMESTSQVNFSRLENFPLAGDDGCGAVQAPARRGSPAGNPQQLRLGDQD